jgi:hypothetical protein
VRKLRFKKGSWLLIPILVLSFFSTPASAGTFVTNGANDYYFELQSGTTFSVRTYAQQYGIDSQLWLYSSNNTLLAVNDDYYGLDSYISYSVQTTETYRLRTSICCGNPDAWYGNSYTIETDSVPTVVPSTISPSTTTSSTTTTTIAPYLNPPQNLTITSTNQEKVYLSWDAPQQSNTQVERYAVFFSKDNWVSGWAISSMQTSAVVENLEPNTEYQFKVRADNDSISVYSEWSNEVSGLTLPTPTTTTTTTTTTSTTTTSTTTSTTTTIPPTTTSVFVFPTIAPTTLPIATTTTITTLSPTTTAATTTIPVVTTIPPTTTTTIPPVSIAQEVLEIVGLNQELSNEQVTEVINILESDSISQEEVANVVDKILESNLSSDQATDLATSSKVLESISPEQAGKIFAEISVSDLSVEQEAALVEALTNAPDNIKESFETEIDIFGEGLDDYVPTGSEIDVKDRRVLIAVTTALTTITTAPMPSGGGSAPSGGGAGGPSGGGGSGNTDRGNSRSRRK